jgi:hypothetical protein
LGEQRDAGGSLREERESQPLAAVSLIRDNLFNDYFFIHR